MKIEQSSVEMASRHSASLHASRSETLRVWIGERPDFEGQANGNAAVESSTRVAISEAAREAAAAASEKAAEAVEAANPVEEPPYDPKLDLLIRIVERLSGEKVRIINASDFTRAPGVPAVPQQAAQAESGMQGWGVEYDYHEVVLEREDTAFAASGEIVTADGKRIRFELTLQMSREYFHSSSVSIRAGDAQRKDPLVINFNGNAAELTDMKFEFDIDADGEADRISFVGPGSGFLVLDRNANGKVDDGTELFGARSGDGFAELAAYDTDGNGWIDENDAVYSDLRIWTKDADGTDRLSTLAERNIGALYLGRASTPFDLKNARNQQHGQVLATGLYLYEDGRAGTMQQLDLFV